MNEFKGRYIFIYLIYLPRSWGLDPKNATTAFIINDTIIWDLFSNNKHRLVLVER